MQTRKVDDPLDFRGYTVDSLQVGKIYVAANSHGYVVLYTGNGWCIPLWGTGDEGLPRKITDYGNIFTLFKGSIVVQN